MEDGNRWSIKEGKTWERELWRASFNKQHSDSKMTRREGTKVERYEEKAQLCLHRTCVHVHSSECSLSLCNSAPRVSGSRTQLCCVTCLTACTEQHTFTYSSHSTCTHI